MKPLFVCAGGGERRLLGTLKGEVTQMSFSAVQEEDTGGPRKGDEKRVNGAISGGGSRCSGGLAWKGGLADDRLVERKRVKFISHSHAARFAGKRVEQFGK